MQGKYIMPGTQIRNTNLHWVQTASRSYQELKASKIECTGKRFAVSMETRC